MLGRAFSNWFGGRPAIDRWAPACDVFTRGKDLVVRIEGRWAEQ